MAEIDRKSTPQTDIVSSDEVVFQVPERGKTRCVSVLHVHEEPRDVKIQT